MLKILAALSVLIAFATSYPTVEYSVESFPSCENSSPDWQERKKVDGVFILIRNGTLILKYCNTETVIPQKVDLSHKGISRFSKDYAKIPGLKRMNLDHNCLEEIEAHIFKGLGDLEELNLAVNKISKVHPNGFDGLTKLRTLNLNYNRIREISWSIGTSNLPALEELFLMRNELTTFERSESNHSPESNIIRLDLTGNRLSDFKYSTLNGENVDDNKFYSLPNLIELYLADNQIEEFSSPDLNLATLDLDNNKLTAFPVLHKNARFVSLNKNQIVCESLSAFKNIPDLAYLQLSDNNFNGLSCLTESNNPFNILQECVYLTLENNELTSIEDIFPPKAPNIEYVSLENNQLTCINANELLRYEIIFTVVYSGNPIPNSIENRFCGPVKNDANRILLMMSPEEYSTSDKNWFKYDWNETDTSLTFLF